MKNFTKKDWVLLSLSASLALFGVIYNEYVIKPDIAAQEAADAINRTSYISPDFKPINVSDIRFCDRSGDCTQRLIDKLNKTR